MLEGDKSLIDFVHKNIFSVEVTEVHQLIAEFKVYSNKGRIIVKVFDSGNFGPLRFSCTGQLEGYESVTGNPDSTIEDAISHVHWSDLDKHKSSKPIAK